MVQVQDTEMEKLSWIIWVGPAYKHTCPPKMEPERGWTVKDGRKALSMEAEPGGVDHSPGMLATTRGWKSPEHTLLEAKSTDPVNTFMLALKDSV